MIKILLTMLVAVFCLPAEAKEVDCLPLPKAPGVFMNTPRYWGTTDSGPILRGFLELHGAAGPLDISHGVDLSHNNANVPYADIKRCGATFAIVKMDGAFAQHREKLNAQDIGVIPYSFLSVANKQGFDYKRHPSSFAGGDKIAKLSAEQTKLLMDEAKAMGNFKSADFLSRYNSALSADKRVSELGGMKGQIIVVDVEETFDPVRYPSTPTQRLAFGRFYARMLSTWIGNVRAGLPDAIFIFYTFPDVFTSYLQFALPADNAVIHGMPVWLARTRPDGSDFDLNSDKNLQRICLSSSGGNKCILHQYSHRVVFTGADITTKKPPDHIDVDRLFPVVTVADKEGVQYLRK